jgi:hypothetical protein
MDPAVAAVTFIVTQDRHAKPKLNLDHTSPHARITQRTFERVAAQFAVHSQVPNS